MSLTPQAQSKKVFLLLFVHKKKALMRASPVTADAGFDR
jgi:hypothetical protein